jgi:hypothetical protein
MALSVLRASVRGKRRKPGPRVPTCRELTYPAPSASLALTTPRRKRNDLGPTRRLRRLRARALKAAFGAKIRLAMTAGG